MLLCNALVYFYNKYIDIWGKDIKQVFGILKYLINAYSHASYHFKRSLNKSSRNIFDQPSPPSCLLWSDDTVSLYFCLFLVTSYKKGSEKLPKTVIAMNDSNHKKISIIFVLFEIKYFKYITKNHYPLYVHRKILYEK